MPEFERIFNQQGKPGLSKTVKALITRKVSVESASAAVDLDLSGLRFARPDSATEDSFVFLDTETNGSGELFCELTELAYRSKDTEFKGGRNPVRKQAGLNKPSADLPVPGEAEFIKAIRELKNKNIIAHNAVFDIKVILKNLYLLGEQVPSGFKGRDEWIDAKYNDFSILEERFDGSFARIIDTVDLAWLVFPNRDSVSLDSLIEDYLPGADTENRHSAAADVDLLYDFVHRVVLERIRKDKGLQSILSLLPEKYLLKQFLNSKGVMPAAKTDLSGIINTFIRDKLVKNDYNPEEIKTRLTRRQQSDDQSVSTINIESVLNSMDWKGRDQPEKDGTGRSGKQYEIIESAIDVLNKGVTGLIEAGTGTGKTIGYLLPLLNFLKNNPGQRTVIVTHTKLLQDQIATELAQLSSSTGIDMKAVTLKGKQNYLCQQRFYSAIEEEKSEIPVYYVYMLSRLYDRGAFSDDLEKIPHHINSVFDPETTYRRRVAFHPAHSKCNDCEWKRGCGIFHRLEKVYDDSTRVIIANDSLLLTRERVGNSQDEPEDFPLLSSYPNAIRYVANNLIVDEAHSLEDTFRSVNAKECSHADFQWLERDFYTRFTEAVQKSEKELKNLIQDIRFPQELHQNFQKIKELLKRIPLKGSAAQIRETIAAFLKLQGLPEDIRYGLQARLVDLPAVAELLRVWSGPGKKFSVMDLLSDFAVWNAEAAIKLTELLEITDDILLKLNESASGGFPNQESVAVFRNFTKQFVTLRNFHNESEITGSWYRELRETVDSVMDQLNTSGEKYTGTLKDKLTSILEKMQEVNDWLKEYESGSLPGQPAIREVLSQPLIQKVLLRQIAFLISRKVLEILADPVTEPALSKDKIIPKEISATEVDSRNLETWLAVLVLLLDVFLKPGFKLRDEYNFDYSFTIKTNIEPENDHKYEESVRTEPVEIQNAKVHGDLTIQFFQNLTGNEISNNLKKFRSKLLVSATLLMQDDPVDENHFAKLYGFSKSDEELILKKIASPFQAGKNIRVMVPQHIPPPAGRFREEHLKDSILEIVRLLRFQKHLNVTENQEHDLHSGARSLFLFTARSNLEVLQSILTDRPELTDSVSLLFQGLMPKAELIRMFSHKPATGQNAALFGLRSFGEGFDIIDSYYKQEKIERINPIKLLVLHKLPLPNPAEPTLASLMDVYVRKQQLETLRWDAIRKSAKKYREGFAAGNEWKQVSQELANEKVYIPRALIDFSQWAGRLLRGMDDTGYLFVLDSRLAGYEWGPSLLSVLQEGAEPADNLRIYGRKYISDEQKRLGSFYSDINDFLENYPDSEDLPQSIRLPALKFIKDKVSVFEEFRDALFPFVKDQTAAIKSGNADSEFLLPDRISLLQDEYANRLIARSNRKKSKLFSKKIMTLADHLFETTKHGELLSSVVQKLDWSVLQSRPALLQSLSRHLDSNETYHWHLKQNIKSLEEDTQEFLALKLASTGKNSIDELINDQARYESVQRSLLTLLRSANLGKRAVPWLQNGDLGILSQVPLLFDLATEKADSRFPNRNDDQIYVLPTGFGKSVIFQIPALLSPGLTIVFTPTLALMEDQTRSMFDRYPEVLDLVQAYHSGTGARSEIRQRIQNEDSRLRLLYMHPSALKDPRIYTALLSHRKVIRFVIDEVHSILDWGNTITPEYHLVLAFLDHYRQIHDFNRTGRPRLFGFTATLSESAGSYLQTLFEKRKYTSNRVTENSGLYRSLVDRRDIFLQKVEIEYENTEAYRDRDIVLNELFAEKLSKLRNIVRKLEPAENRKVIVFCRTAGVKSGRGKTPRGVEQVFRGIFSNTNDSVLSGELKRKSLMIYGSIEDKDRKLARLNRSPLIVATSALGVGIDLKNVRAVVMFDLPESPESFLQYMGRIRKAGNGNQKRTCYYFWNELDNELNSWVFEKRTEAFTLAKKSYRVYNNTHPFYLKPYDNENITEEKKWKVYPPELLHYADGMADILFDYNTLSRFFADKDINKASKVFNRLLLHLHRTNPKVTILGFLPGAKSDVVIEKFSDRKYLFLKREGLNSVLDSRLTEKVLIRAGYSAQKDRDLVKTCIEFLEEKITTSESGGYRRCQLDNLYLSMNTTDEKTLDKLLESVDENEHSLLGGKIMAAVQILHAHDFIRFSYRADAPLMRLPAREECGTYLFEETFEGYFEWNGGSIRFDEQRIPDDYLEIQTENRQQMMKALGGTACLRTGLVQLFSTEEAELIEKVRQHPAANHLYEDCCSNCDMQNATFGAKIGAE